MLAAGGLFAEVCDADPADPDYANPKNKLTAPDVCPDPCTD